MTTDLTKLTGSAKFENRTFTPEEIQQIAQSKKLLGIAFINCPINNEDVLELSKLSKLVNVTLENTHISDKALEYLARLSELKYLFISKAAITGSGFEHFINHKKLDCVWARSTQLTDESLKLLAKIPKLETLVINDTHVTLEGLLAIATNAKIHVVAPDLFTTEQIELFEHEQRKLAKKSLVIDEQEVERAKQALLLFFAAMTEWEQYANEVGFTDELEERCKALFKKHCVDKPRSGNRPDQLHYSGGPDYTYGRDRFVDAEQVSENKIYLYTKCNIDFQYRFILIKEHNEWKVDERLWKSGGWKKHGL